MQSNWREILSWQLIDNDFTKTEVDKNGNRRFYNNKGQLHRLSGPAIEWSNGSKEWYKDDKRHRLDGPAIEWRNGSKAWYKDDKRRGSSREGFTEEEDFED